MILVGSKLGISEIYAYLMHNIKKPKISCDYKGVSQDPKFGTEIPKSWEKSQRVVVLLKNISKISAFPPGKISADAHAYTFTSVHQENHNRSLCATELFIWVNAVEMQHIHVWIKLLV